MKVCPKCKRNLQKNKFWKSKVRRDGYQLWCKECSKKAKKVQYHTGRRDAVQRLSRNTQLKSKYNITIEDYEWMLLNQGGVCKICKKPETQRSNPKGRVDSLRVDHCHKTGKIRGLLCSKCNFGISQFNDDIKLLQEAIKYLSLTNHQKSDIM